MTRDGRDPQPRLGRERRERAQEVEDVGLVAGAAAAEHVGVDDDERLSRQLPPDRLDGVGDGSPGIGLRPLEPGARSSSCRADASSIPAAIASTSSGSTSTAAPPATSSVAPPALVTTGVPQAIASSTGIPKPS